MDGVKRLQSQLLGSKQEDQRFMTTLHYIWSWKPACVRDLVSKRKQTNKSRKELARIRVEEVFQAIKIRCGRHRKWIEVKRGWGSTGNGCLL